MKARQIGVRRDECRPHFGRIALLEGFDRFNDSFLRGRTTIQLFECVSNILDEIIHGSGRFRSRHCQVNQMMDAQCAASRYCVGDPTPFCFSDELVKGGQTPTVNHSVPIDGKKRQLVLGVIDDRREKNPWNISIVGLATGVVFVPRQWSSPAFRTQAQCLSTNFIANPATAKNRLSIRTPDPPAGAMLSLSAMALPPLRHGEWQELYRHDLH